MKILSIETSCDDTGISILEAKGSIANASFSVLADNVSSQINVHIPYGGVFPALAKREHIKNLPLVLEKTLKEAKMQKKNEGPTFVNPGIDLIAVTHGPGLEPALWTGIVFAKELSKKWGVPVIPVNHMEGHALSVFGRKKGKFEVLKTKNPTLSLLVSGGHTELVLTKKWMNYKVIGQTLDDAVGEAFDKVARMLGLPYPGGPQISKLAEEARNREKEKGTFQGRNFSAKKFTPSSGRRPAESSQSSLSFSLPRPMLYSKNFDFSFSGLKTAVLYLIRDIGQLDDKTKSAIALEFENAAIECLVKKTAKAIEQFKIKTLVVAGGVAANTHLRNEMRKITTAKAGQASKKVRLMFPTRELSTDNAVMIGIVGYLNYIKNKKKVPRLSSIKASGNLSL
jgi:N6-L-threonylcarbamoyladenine synthase